MKKTVKYFIHVTVMVSGVILLSACHEERSNLLSNTPVANVTPTQPLPNTVQNAPQCVQGTYNTACQPNVLLKQ
jgi:hypothetical protein